MDEKDKKNFVIIEDKKNPFTGGNMVGINLLKELNKIENKFSLIDFEEDFPSIKIAGERLPKINFFKKIITFPKNSKLLFVYYFDVVSLLILVFSFLKKNSVAVSFHTFFKKPGFFFATVYFFKRLILVNSALIFADKLIFLTQAQKDFFSKYVFLRARFNRKSEVIPNFIRSERLLKVDTNKYKKPRVIFVGRLTSQKGLDLLRQAIDRFSNINFTVVGSGDKIFADYLRKKKNVHFIEKIKNKELMKIYEFSNILFLPSYSEVFPLVVLEAMSKGLAIILSDIPGMREIVEEKENGFFFKPGDIEAACNALNFCFNNSKDIEEIGKKNIVKSKRFNPQMAASKYLKIMNEV
jgi:glycosyltransferase involved in cell wall biosynthesis